jgi:hypothetical protein
LVEEAFEGGFTISFFGKNFTFPSVEYILNENISILFTRLKKNRDKEFSVYRNMSAEKPIN